MNKKQKELKQLLKTYKKVYGKNIVTIDPDVADVAFLQILVNLQYLRDVKLMTREAGVENQATNSLQDAIVCCANYLLTKEEMMDLNKSAAERLELSTKKDLCYRQFWTLVMHNFEGWFE